MNKFALGNTVKIKANGLTGMIVGFWSELNGGSQYNIRYSDKEGCLHTTWLYEQELEEIEAEGTGGSATDDC